NSFDGWNASAHGLPLRAVPGRDVRSQGCAGLGELTRGNTPASIGAESLNAAVESSAHRSPLRSIPTGDVRRCNVDGVFTRLWVVAHSVEAATSDQAIFIDR